MNAKQALKAASKHIEELEYANRLYAVDVQAYNAVIDGTVDGRSICEWCEDQHECEKAEKGGAGCHEWMLMWNHQEGEDDEKTVGSDDGAADSGNGDSSGAGRGDGDDLGDLPAGLRGEHSIQGIIPE
jgi:hypothetical protein